MAQSDSSRAVEELAQALYEARDPSGVPWARRGRIVREPWLEVARLQIAASRDSSET